MKRLALLAALAPGCLGPLASDAPAAGEDILPPGATVPSWIDDPAIRAKIAAHQGVSGTVRLESAFAGGAPVHVWDFGAAPTLAAPLFMLVRNDGSGNVSRVAHNTIVKALPGDPGYSPFWAVLYIEVTDAYGGEILASDDAINEAVAAGLVRAPVLQKLAVNCPIVTPDVRLDVGGGATLAPDGTFYYDGKSVPYFNFGPMPIGDQTLVPEQRRYVLHREGEEPLSEPERNIDMDGDGDIADTNDIYTDPPAAATSSPLARTVTVAIPAGTASIDTTHDETMAAITNAAQLFDPMPTASVVGYQITTERHNRPGQKHAGGL